MGSKTTALVDRFLATHHGQWLALRPLSRETWVWVLFHWMAHQIDPYVHPLLLDLLLPGIRQRRGGTARHEGVLCETTGKISELFRASGGIWP